MAFSFPFPPIPISVAVILIPISVDSVVIQVGVTLFTSKNDKVMTFFAHPPTNYRHHSHPLRLVQVTVCPVFLYIHP